MPAEPDPLNGTAPHAHDLSSRHRRFFVDLSGRIENARHGLETVALAVKLAVKHKVQKPYASATLRVGQQASHRRAPDMLLSSVLRAVGDETLGRHGPGARVLHPAVQSFPEIHGRRKEAKMTIVYYRDSAQGSVLARIVREVLVHPLRLSSFAVAITHKMESYCSLCISRLDTERSMTLRLTERLTVAQFGFITQLELQSVIFATFLDFARVVCAFPMLRGLWMANIVCKGNDFCGLEDVAFAQHLSPAYVHVRPPILDQSRNTDESRIYSIDRGSS